MRVQAKISILLGIIAISIVRTSHAIDATFKSSLEQFSNNLFGELVAASMDKNVIYSPLSTQICLAMVRMGAEGETATELDHSLGYTGQSDETIANNYFALLSQYENSGNVHLANKVYVQKGYEFQDGYSDVLGQKFFSSPESIDFANNEVAANTMNKWVESSTNSSIKDIVQPAQLSSDTQMVLVNAIHFKGQWELRFPSRSTDEEDFFVNETSSVKVQMMQRNGRFMHAFFPQLQASGIRMQYEDSDLAMIILLPDSHTGLASLQDKLKDIKLDTLCRQMYVRYVTVALPKFNVEYEIEMTEPLGKLGIKNIFTTPNFGKMLKTPKPASVSKIIHKAVIKVTERGTEAAAVTEMFKMPYINHEPFVVEHPFYYAIVNNDNVILFQGNVVTL